MRVLFSRQQSGEFPRTLFVIQASTFYESHPKKKKKKKNGKEQGEGKQVEVTGGEESSI